MLRDNREGVAAVKGGFSQLIRVQTIALRADNRDQSVDDRHQHHAENAGFNRIFRDRTRFLDTHLFDHVDNDNAECQRSQRV